MRVRVRYRTKSKQAVFDVEADDVESIKAQNWTMGRHVESVNCQIKEGDKCELPRKLMRRRGGRGDPEPGGTQTHQNASTGCELSFPWVLTLPPQQPADLAPACAWAYFIERAAGVEPASSPW
jgi:hypothetical protein